MCLRRCTKRPWQWRILVCLVSCQLPVLLMGFAAGVSAPAQAADALQQRFITLGTAGVTGVYYPAGGAACKLVNETRAGHGIRCSVESTLGTITNIRQIRSGGLDFGFAQSDWLHHAYLGTSNFQEDGPFRDLRTVLTLHREVATLVVRDTSRFSSLEDLKGARINIGAAGSGSFASWQTLAELLGWTDADNIALSHTGSSAVPEELCSGAIDAYFVLIGHPAALIEETQEQCGIRLIGLHEAALEPFATEAPYYRAASIPAGLYGLETPVRSFGVGASVVTTSEMPEDVVRVLVAAVAANFDEFKTLHPALSGLEQADLAASSAVVPLHPAAAQFFAEHGLLPDQNIGR